MKILITSQGSAPDDDVDERFGRARHFLLFDADTGTWSAHDNAVNLQAAQGAGVQAASQAHRLKADVVITGHCGPKAFRVLASAGIQVVLEAKGTVKQALTDFQEGRLQAHENPDREGHW
jgi:predicted Fe-Mo cluster-binding NifX family protein